MLENRIGQWLRGGAIALACIGGSAQAVTYNGIWDPAYGAPFTNLGWRGTASYYVPDSCVPSGSSDVDNATDCGGSAAITAAQVEFYAVDDPYETTVASVGFDAGSILVNTLRFVNGELNQLSTAFSSLALPSGDLSAFSVLPATYFALQFGLPGEYSDEGGPRLAWANGCLRTRTDNNSLTYNSAYDSVSTECTYGFNDPGIPFRHWEIARVPEPASLALALLALSLVPVFRRRAMRR